MDLQPLPQLLMDGLDHIIAALLFQRLAQSLVEGFPLVSGGHGHLGAEHRVDEILMDLLGILGVKQGVINVSGPVVKAGEHEAQLRGGHDLARGEILESALLRAVAELHLSGLHRADAAEDIAEHLV